jgi:gliding motility-associated-like protein
MRTRIYLSIFLSLFFHLFALAQCPPPGFPEPGNTCAQAPILCENLDGYCSTINNNNVSQPFPGCGWPWTLNNDEWFAFFAGSTSITVQVTPLNCSPGANQGLQGAIYFGCGGPVMDVQCECTEDPFILTSNNFIVGQVYWVVLDGCGGNVCDYEIDVLSGSTVGVPPDNPGPVTGSTNVCQGSTAPYSLPPVTGATIYNWTLSPSSAGTISGTNNNINVTWGNTPGPATLCVWTENLCYENPTTSCITVNVIPTPTATLSGSGVICGQGNNDPAELTVTFTGTGPWQFGYSIGGVPQTPITTSSNPYTLIVNAPGTVALTSVSTTTGNCPGTVSGSVSIPLINVTAQPQGANPGCNGASTGSINLSVGGGTSPYTYNWSNGSNVQNPANLPAGTYTVTVTDANGCTQTASVTLTNPPQLTASATGANPGCNGGNNGSIDLTAGGGTPPYTYNWSNGSTSQDPTGLPAGTYNGTVTDANGCTQTVSVTLTNPPQLTASASGTNPLCFGNANGSITTSVGGGTPPYTYSWSNGSSSANPANLPAGTYNGTVTDANGCQQTVSVTLTQPPQLTASATGTAPVCNNGSNGSINLTVNGGTTPYSFNWSNGSNVQNPTNLPAGNYSVTVTDANGCTQTASVNLANPPAITATTQVTNPLCNGGSTGSINLTVGNGTAPYSYNWSNGSTVQDPANLSAGSYTVTVTDANGCTQTASAALTNPPQLVAAVTNTQQVDCTHPTGSINTSVSGGTPGYTYQWSPSGSGANPTGLTAGTYNATVTDANGCTVTISATVNSNLTPPTAAASANGILTCTVTTLTLSGAGSSSGGNFSYQWSGPGIVSGGNSINPVVNAPGTYTITVTNTSNGCTSTASVSVSQNTTPPVAAGTAPPITCNNPSVTISGAGSSTGPNFTYQWTGPGIVSGGNTLNPVVNQPGNYTLLVTNTDNGCTATTVVNVPNQTQPPAATATAPTLTCTNTSVTINGSGSATGPNITYLWTTNNGNIVSGATTLNPVVNQPGSYTLTVTNNTTGCQNSVTVNVSQNITPPTAEAGPSFQLDCGSPTLQLNGAGSSAGPGFTYQWAGPGVIGGGNTLMPTVNQPGTYTLTVTNTSNGCTASDQVIVTQDVVPPIATIAAPATITCAVPQVQLNGAGSSTGPNFTYNWTTQGGVIVGGGNTLTPTVGGGGLYILTVTNTNNDCTASFSVVVPINITPPVANAGPVAELTCVVNMVQLIGAGSSSGPNFSYQWTTPNGNIVSGGNTLFPIANAPGSYTLTVTNSTNGCTSSSTTQVVVDEDVPIANAGQPQVLTCAIQQVALNGTGSSSGPLFSFQWSTTNGNIVSGGNTPTPIVNLPGQYQLTVTSQSNGCQSSSFVTVTQNIVLPTVTIQPPGEVNCYTPQITLDATGSSSQGNFSYSWNTATGNIVSGQGTLSPLVDQGGTYILTIVNNTTGCINGSGVTVAEDIDNPTLVIVAPGIVSCATPQLTLNASGSSAGPNFQYTWTTADGTIVSGANTLNPVVSSGGTYDLFILNQTNNCSTSGSVVVPENADLPTIDLASPQGLNCTIETVSLQATIGNGANLQFVWSTADGNFASGQNTLQPLVDAPGTYLIEVTNPATGCTSTDQVVVGQDIVIPVANAGPEGMLTCVATSLQLDGSASGAGPGLTYAWTTTGGNIVLGGNSTTPLVDEPGTYILTVVNTQNTCQAADTVVVDENVLIPQALAEEPILMGCLNPVISLDATASSTGAQIVYEWATSDGNIVSGGNTLQPQVDAPGLYTLTVLDTINGCQSDSELTVVQDIELPGVDAGPGVELTCTLTEYTLQGAATGQTNRFEYLWTTTDGNILNGETTLNPLVGEAGIYLLTVTDTINNCTASASVEITQDANVPVADVLPSNDLNCYFPTVTLDGSGSSQSASLVYTWSTPNGNFVSGTETLAPVIDQAGSYTLTINDTINDCITSQTLLIVADTAAPQLVIAAPDQLNCYQPEIQLNATAGGLTDIALVWTTSGGNLTENENTLTPSADQPGIYVLEVTNNLNGCTSSIQALVDSDFAIPQADAGPGNVITCADTLITLQGMGDGGGAPLSFLWTTSGGNILSGADSPEPVVDAGGLYAILVTNTQNGCSNTGEVTITVDQAYPVADPGPEGLLNCYFPDIQLDGSTSSSGPSFSYSWTTAGGNILNGANTLTPQVDQPGVYELAILNTLNQCVSTNTVTVLEDVEVPLADAGPASELTCSLTEVALSSSGSTGPEFTYSWATTDGNIISGGNTLSPLINAAGTYDLTVFDQENGCSSISQVTITTGVSYPDAVTAEAAPITCAVPQIQLSGLGSDTGPDFGYQWSTPDGNIVSGGNTLEPLVNQPGAYTLTVTNLNNDCISTALVEVPIDTVAPLAQAGPSGLLTCTVQQLQLSGAGSSAGPGFTYNWTTADGAIQSGASTLAPTIDAPGLYTLEVFNLLNGCSTSDVVLVNEDVTPPAAASATPGLLTCAVTSLTLSGAGSSTGAIYNYSWTTTDGNILSGANTLAPQVNEPGQYNLLVTNTLNGCTSSSAVNVGQDIVAPAAEAGSAGDLTCAVTSLSLSATASGASQNLQYNWTTANGSILSGASTLTPLIGAPGAYLLTVLDQVNGCSSTDQVLVGQNITPPVLVIAAPGVLTCAQTQVALNAAGSNTGAPFDLIWTTGNGNIISGAQSINPAVDTPGAYTLTITNALNGCKSSGTVQVTEDIAPPVVDAGQDFTLPCFEDTGYLEGSATAATSNLQFVWTTTGGQIVSGANTLSPGITSGGLYSLTVTNLVNGCSAADEVLISENYPASPDFVPSQPLCYGDPGQIQILVVSGGTPPYLYSVNGGFTYQSNPLFTNLPAGDYAIMVQDALGCETEIQQQAITEPEPVLVDAGISVELLQGDSYQFQVEVNLSPAAIQQIIWTPPLGLSCTDCLDPTVMPLQTALYTVEVIDEHGCRGAASVQVFVDERPLVFVPNIFSPNGDGENDILLIFAREENIRQIRSFLIFDRWGEAVFENYGFLPNNPAFGWDGKHRGQPLNPAVFAWFAEIEFIDGRVELFEGGVSLIR